MKRGIWLLLFAVLALTTVWVMPYLSLKELRTAAADGDAERFSAQVDFEALRQNLKRGVQDQLLGAERDAQGRPSPARAIGAAVAGALLGPMVDTLVTPESLARLMQGQRPAAAATGLGGPAAQGGDSPPLETAMRYESLNRFVFSVRPRDAEADEAPVELVLHRRGLLQWRLAELRLP